VLAPENKGKGVGLHGEEGGVRGANSAPVSNTMKTQNEMTRKLRISFLIKKDKVERGPFARKIPGKGSRGTQKRLCRKMERKGDVTMNPRVCHKKGALESE